MWHSGSASALHAESPGFDSPHLHRIRVRAVQGARLKFECVRTRRTFLCWDTSLITKAKVLYQSGDFLSQVNPIAMPYCCRWPPHLFLLPFRTCWMGWRRAIRPGLLAV
eukprot:scaffold14339_cov84-Skeletonema_dohrnii-CCMP3373.AAC.3